jgi:hypothetical protein
MPIEKTNPITGHELTLMPPTAQQPPPFGWIRLLNGNTDAGYVYLGLQNPPSDPHLGGGGTYIVTAMPFDTMGHLLEILRNERNLQIRFFDPQSPGVSPSAFIEAVSSTPSPAANELHVPTEVKTDIDRLLKKQKA